MHTSRDNFRFLTEAPVHRVVLTMAVPTIISMLVTALYNLADTFFVSQINTQATAAVGIVFSIMSMVQALGFFFGHGSGNYVARKLGARQTEEAEVMAATGFAYSLTAGMLVALLACFFTTDLSLALGSTATILPYTEAYLGIALWGAPFMTASLTLNNQMRFQGNAGYAMFGILSGALLNVVLDPLLIFVFDMGIQGAACATVVSQFVGFLVLLRMTREGGGIRIRLSRVSFRPTLLKEILFGGTPSLMRQGLTGLSVIALNLAAACFGDSAIAGMSIVSRSCYFVFAATIGLGQGFQPLCGFCYGARRYDRVREGFFFCVKTGSVFLLTCAVAGMVFAPEIVSFFRNEAEVVAVGAAALRWQMVSFVLLPTIGLTNMMMQTIRRPLEANFVAAARSGLFFIPLVLWLPRCWGLTGLEMCQAVSDVLSFVVCFFIARRAFRMMRRMENEKDTVQNTEGVF